jgi:hypothetical protein
MQRMRILLQQKDTGLYFRDINSWCADAWDAMDFVSSTKALEFCAVNQLEAVQVVLKFEDEKYEIVLPDVTGQPGGADRPTLKA